MRKYLVLTSLILVMFACSKKEKYSFEQPKNLILLIGDGMGLTQVCAGWTADGGNLNLEKCSHVGLQKTYSANAYITDSGASGTAMATGVKTFNGSIGVDTAGNPVTSILELAEQAGLASGLISTSSITHATPASFIAHIRNRNRYQAIAADFLKTDIDVIIGGGRNHFTRRWDGQNLLDSFRVREYHVADNLDVIREINSGKLVCLTDTMHCPPAANGRGDMLPQAAEQALRILDQNKKGFFMMIEGSQIDWAAHEGNTQYLISEVLDFDETIGKVLDFAEKDGETLVVITADHETGGMALTGGNIQTGSVSAVYATDGHSAVMVPVFAWGPGAELFAGIYENTDIFEKMKKALGL